MTVHVCGIDPGLATMGLAKAVLHNNGEIEVLSLDVICTKKSEKKRNLSAAEDLARRGAEIASNLFHPYGFSAVCAESMSYPRNASAACKLGISWGIVIAWTYHDHIPLIHASPQAIKKVVTGDRRASKDDMVAAIKAKYPDLVWPTQKTLRGHCADAAGAILAQADSPIFRALLKAHQ